MEDIRIAIGRIEEYVNGMTADNFYADYKTIDAVVKNLTVIGEAAKNIPEEIKQAHQEIPWEEIAGMRNKVVHEYFGVDEEILWETIKNDLPVFKKQISKIEVE